jgi:hypothetical protein
MQHDQMLVALLTRQHGYDLSTIHAVLADTRTRLRQRGHTQTALFYTYRTGGGTDSLATAAAPSSRPRRVLAFATPDSALALAQHNRLSPPPRLLRVSLVQLLVVLIQRPAIAAVLVADEPLELPPRGQLPAALRLERLNVVHRLQGEEHGQPF